MPMRLCSSALRAVLSVYAGPQALPGPYRLYRLSTINHYQSR